MKWTLLVILTVGAFASSLDYELLYFAAAEPRDIATILAETNTTTVELELFKCDAPNRDRLFNDITPQNPARDSFKILGTNKKTYTYKDAKIYSIKGHRIKNLKDPFLRSAYKALNQIAQFPIGLELISKIQTANAPFYLKYGRNSYYPSMPHERTFLHGNEASFVTAMDELKPSVDGMPFAQIGFTGSINWNSKSKIKLVESDYVEREVSPVIALAHEMVHAYDGMRGLLDRRFVHGDNYEMATVAEYRAVFLENKIRKHMGILYRRYYSKPSGEPVEKDMLDDTDEPIVMPTPCIRWL
jgi:hypothetical protein